MNDETFKSDRPRRSARAPVKLTYNTTIQSKRKTDKAGEDSIDVKSSAHKKQKLDPLQSLFQDPNSALTTMDIADCLNADTWDSLSEAARNRLFVLLPSTAFVGYNPSVDPTHPSKLHPSDPNTMAVDMPDEFRCADTVDPSIFTDPYFLAAAHTFQDHIFTGWMSDTHIEKRNKFEAGVIDGSMHAPWKDEVWLKDHVNIGVRREDMSTCAQQSDWSARAGEAAELKLTDLAEGKILRVGDVLSYRRNFSQLDITIEKDVIIDTINPRTYAITVFVQRGTDPQLPPGLLERNPSEPTEHTKQMTISSPSQLENGVLDLDGRVEKARRPNGNAWKCFTVWRWSEEMDFASGADSKGGRENNGTLFYLRGNYYHER